MALKVTKVEMWSTIIDDRAGGLADKIDPLTKAGASFEFVFARRMPEQPGRGLALISPVKGRKVTAAATAIGFTRALDLTALRIDGGDKPGSAARITRSLAAAGISFRGLSACSIGTKFVAYLAFDNADDAAKAAAVLRKA
jgi:hypothetical protein